MNQPKPLQRGDTIYMVAPSFGVTTEPYLTRYSESAKRFRREGYVVIEGENVHLAEGVASSASPKARAEEIMKAYQSDAQLILSVGGGEMMMEILPYLDFGYIRNHPKWFMGFSDNTNLTFPLALLSDTVSIYGSCAASFFQKKWRLSELDAIAMLSGKTHFEGYPKYSITKKNEAHPLWTYRLTQPKIIQSLNYQEPIEGRLLGGCLDCILNLIGTPYADMSAFRSRNKGEGIIWFLEACDLNPLDIRRGLWRMKEAGYFDDAKAFLFGRHLCRDFELLEVNKYNAVTDILGEMGLPILMDIDLGHIPPSLPILEGAKARVALKQGNIIFDYIQ